MGGKFHMQWGVFERLEKAAETFSGSWSDIVKHFNAICTHSYDFDHLKVNYNLINVLFFNY